MRQVAIGSLIALLLGSPPVMAQNFSLKQCNKITSVGPEELAVVSSNPSLLCSADCTASANGGRVVVYDTPDGVSHTQARVLAEPGVATSGNYATTGETKRFAFYGLTVEAHNCYANIHWQD